MSAGRHNKAAPTDRGDTLLMLSGGIDSVYALYVHLTTTSDPIRTHHVHLRNWEGRDREEAAAVQRVLAWARRNGYADRVVHTQSTTDYGDLRYIVQDHHTWGYWAGIILANPANAGITRIIRTMHQDDGLRGGVEQPDKQDRIREAWARPIEMIAKREIEFVWPLRELTKAQIMQGLPPELLNVCWYCRRPRFRQPCGECHTCKQVQAAMSEPASPARKRRAPAKKRAPAKPAAVTATEGAAAPAPAQAEDAPPVRARPRRSRKRKGT